MMNALINTLQINNRITLYMLDGIDAAHLTDKAGGRGRSVGEQFAHLHNVRLMWLDVSAPALKGGLEKIEKEKALDKELLIASLTASGEAMGQLLAQGLEAGKIKNFKPHPEAFLGYILAHDAHHRGQAALILKLNGHPLDKKISFGMWEWGVR